MTLQMSQNGAISYGHFALAEGLSKECDSATVMNVVKKYIATISKDIRISSIDLFSSVEHFDRGETLSQPKAFFGDCIVSIWFNEVTLQPRKFYFYDNGGAEEYVGNKWKP